MDKPVGEGVQKNKCSVSDGSQQPRDPVRHYQYVWLRFAPRFPDLCLGELSQTADRCLSELRQAGPFSRPGKHGS